jgi:tetratricopeptide (TPR) repeat protein
VWVVGLDSETFDRGIINVAAIQEALKRSSLYVLFLTKDALASGAVRYEAILAQELFARGVIDRFLVICLDEQAFASADEQWKAFNFVRRAPGVPSIARLIQHNLLANRAKEKGTSQPFVGRTTPLHDTKEKLIDPSASKIRALYVSGFTGIGRHTFSRHLFRDVYPGVLSVFPEITIERLDGYDEIYRKLSDRLSPLATLSAWRARITGFAHADESGKADLSAQLLSNLLLSREAVIITDHDGLLDGDGAFQAPLKNILQRVPPQNRPSIIFIGQRMVPYRHRNEVGGVLYCALPSLSPDEIRQLVAFLLKDAGIEYTTEELNRVVQLCDGHPFNATFLAEAIKEYTLAVVLGDPSEITQWKRRRANQFLQDLQFSDEEAAILATLKDFSVLDFDLLSQVVGGKIEEVSKAISRLMDYHMVETIGDTFLIAPPMRDAVERDQRFSLAPDRHRRMLSTISNQLIAANDDASVSLSLVEAGVLARLQEGKELSPLFSSFLLPSHLVWLARRRYNEENNQEAIRLAREALERRQSLSPAGRVEACRFLCLAAARRGQKDDFHYGVQVLKAVAVEPWSRSTLNFVLGFNARIDGRVPEAEEYFRLAYQDSPRNFHAARELASCCLIRGNHDDAEKFAREAFEIAQDNAYILDFLLSVLIRSDRLRVKRAEPEIETLFERLKQAGEEHGRSFYATRRAEYELRWGSVDAACKLIDEAVRQSPGIFNVHALRAEIYLERGNNATAWEEIRKMHDIVYRNSSGERLTNLRPYLVLEASYKAATGDFNGAKEIYRNKDVFTEQEGSAAVRQIEIEQAYRRR